MTAALLRYFGTLGGSALDTKEQRMCEYYDCSLGGGSQHNPTARQFLDVHQLPPKPRGTHRFVIISDTHEYHHRLVLPEADLLLHCGDILLSDIMSPRWLSWLRAKAFFRWVESLHQITTKIVIAGNHDAVLERYGAVAVRKIAGPTTHYLENECVTVFGFTIFGTPRSIGKSHNRAFQGDASWKTTPLESHRHTPINSSSRSAPTPRGNSNTTSSKNTTDTAGRYTDRGNNNKTEQSMDEESTTALLSASPQDGRGDVFTTRQRGVGTAKCPIDILVSHQPAHHLRMRDWCSTLDIRLAHFCGHDHAGHGLHYHLPSGIPSFNASSLRGKFCRERLQPVTVVDLPQPLRSSSL